MVGYVSRRLIDASNVAVDTDDVKEAINESIAYWKFYRFMFNTVVDTSVLTALNPVLPIPANFLVPVNEDDGFYIEYGGVRYPLEKVSKQRYDAMYVSNSYGLPRFYSSFGLLDFRVYPIPDTAYDVGRWYLKDYEVLVADSATNDFTDYASRLINLWALKTLMAEIRQDMPMSAYYENAAMDQKRQLTVGTDKANKSGKLTIYSNLTGA